MININTREAYTLGTTAHIWDDQLTFDQMPTKETKRSYLQGVFDERAIITIHDQISCEGLTDNMISFINATMSSVSRGVWLGVNAVECLEFLYNRGSLFNTANLHLFVLWTTSTPRCSDTRERMHGVSDIKWRRTDPLAVPPKKSRFTDAGYDLSVIRLTKVSNGVYYYDTGIAIDPPSGFYFDLVGRSSISKTGWMLANNIGIIDASYRGSIRVALVRVHPEAQEICLPTRLVQLIPRKLELFNLVETYDMSRTSREEGCFGSTGC